MELRKCQYCTKPFYCLPHHTLKDKDAGRLVCEESEKCFCSIGCKLALELTPLNYDVEYNDEIAPEEIARPFFEKPEDPKRESANIYRIALLCREDPVACVVLLMAILPGQTQKMIGEHFGRFHDQITEDKTTPGITKMAVSKNMGKLTRLYPDLTRIMSKGAEA